MSNNDKKWIFFGVAAAVLSVGAVGLYYFYQQQQTGTRATSKSTKASSAKRNIKNIFSADTPSQPTTPTSASSASGKQTHAALALAHHKSKAYRQSIDEWTLAIADEPNNAKLYTNRANTLILTKEYEAAVADGLKATQLNPSSALAWYSYGRGLAFIDKPSEAVDAFTRALNSDGNETIAKQATEMRSQAALKASLRADFGATKVEVAPQVEHPPTVPITNPYAALDAEAGEEVKTAIDHDRERVEAEVRRAEEEERRRQTVEDDKKASSNAAEDDESEWNQPHRRTRHAHPTQNTEQSNESAPSVAPSSSASSSALPSSAAPSAAPSSTPHNAASHDDLRQIAIDEHKRIERQKAVNAAEKQHATSSIKPTSAMSNSMNDSGVFVDKEEGMSQSTDTKTHSTWAAVAASLPSTPEPVVLPPAAEQEQQISTVEADNSTRKSATNASEPTVKADYTNGTETHHATAATAASGSWAAVASTLVSPSSHSNVITLPTAHADEHTANGDDLHVKHTTETSHSALSPPQPTVNNNSASVPSSPLLKSQSTTSRLRADNATKTRKQQRADSERT